MLSTSCFYKAIILALGCEPCQRRRQPAPALLSQKQVPLRPRSLLRRLRQDYRRQPPAPPPDPYGFPTQIDPGQRYLFYLHGKIIEDQGLPAISPEFGKYRYTEILQVLADNGFTVISEQRPKNADGWAYARKGARQIAELMQAGVPPGQITVVGASKGAAIAAGISNLVWGTRR